MLSFASPDSTPLPQVISQNRLDPFFWLVQKGVCMCMCVREFINTSFFVCYMIDIICYNI